MRDVTPEPKGWRRRAARALAWALGAGLLTLAPEADAASEVAPPGDDDAPVSSGGEVAPRAPEDGEAREGEGEVAPRESDATSEGTETPVRRESETREGTEAALRESETSDGRDAPPRDSDAVQPPRGDGQVDGSGTTAPSPVFRGEARSTVLPEERGRGRLSQYLQRSVRYGARFLDHGVLQPAIAGGWPHAYRVELSLGLLDHLTIGATAHWLPGQRRPQVAPIVAIAILRGRLYEFGVWHFWSLFPPPRQDLDPTTPSYPRRMQWYLATASFGQAWLTGGLAAGGGRARQNDPAKDPAVDTTNPSTIRWRFGGGLHLRAGTRRWGFTAQVLVPDLHAELRFDLRFGLFEQRSKGGWKPHGMAEDWDRGAPWQTSH